MIINTLRITGISAGIYTGLLLKLSFDVIKLRRKHKVALGSGGHADLEGSIRAQGNFAEYAPFALVNLACLESNGAPWWVVGGGAAAFLVARVIHAVGLQRAKVDTRVTGMILTISSLSIFQVILTRAPTSAHHHTLSLFREMRCIIFSI
jgi:uncharacterized protein